VKSTLSQQYLSELWRRLMRDEFGGSGLVGEPNRAMLPEALLELLAGLS
jgi:hypothetical protein